MLVQSEGWVHIEWWGQKWKHYTLNTPCAPFSAMCCFPNTRHTFHLQALSLHFPCQLSRPCFCIIPFTEVFLILLNSESILPSLGPSTPFLLYVWHSDNMFCFFLYLSMSIWRERQISNFLYYSSLTYAMEPYV